MRTLIQEVETEHTPLSLASSLKDQTGLVVLQSALFHGPEVRFSYVAVDPFLSFEAQSSRCELTFNGRVSKHFCNPWILLEELMQKYELLEESDQPFPLGGVFGYWGYELNRSLTTKLASKAERDLELPDLSLGFYDSLCVFDHHLKKCIIVSTGMQADGSRSVDRAHKGMQKWKEILGQPPLEMAMASRSILQGEEQLCSNLSRQSFVNRVTRAKEYISAGDIYQINLSHRLQVAIEADGFDFYRRLLEVSPAPYAAFLHCGTFEIASASPESFLRMSGRHIRTRPIKGTRPRSSDPEEDARLTFELQSSQKELAELVMITDLLRNDLGQICEYGSVSVPELIRLERYPQVQHLVSTVEGRLGVSISHTQALAASFPGGSITGTPKLRAMQLIDELEPLARGPYTGAIGFIGFNQESHLSITIRTAVKKGPELYFSVGAGIVADSDPEAEYEETLAKGRGFIEALGITQKLSVSSLGGDGPDRVLSGTVRSGS